MYARAAPLLALLGAACGSVESHLRPERAIPELQALARAYEQQPRRTVFAAGVDRVFGPVRVAVHEIGAGDRERVLVLVHGVLADHRTWRYVAGGLAAEHDVWALDLPGCGGSDVPGVLQLEPDGYSPGWLARLALDVLRQRLAARGTRPRLTLVGHSLGGGVLLRMLGDRTLRASYGDVLAAVDSAVLLAPLDFGFGKADPLFVELSKASDLEMLLGAATGLLRRATAESIYQGGVDVTRVPSEGVDELYEILMDPARRRAAQQMLLRAAPFDPDARLRWQEAEQLTADYRNVDVPCLVIWGERDETLPAQSGDRLVHELPQAWLRVVRACKHSLPTEEPRLVVDQIRRFLSAERAGWSEFTRLDRPPPAGPAPAEHAVLRTAQRDTVSRGHLEPAAGAPSTLTVLRGRDLERSGVRYLADALRLVPGVEVERVSATEAGVSFRGYVDSATAAQGTLGLVDGRQVQNPFLGNVLWDQLPVRLDDVEQIEVIRGPGSFLHGPNAMHGVVSITTRSPLSYAQSTASTSVAGGTDGFAELGATGVHRTDNTGFKVSAQWADSDRFDAGTAGSGDDSRDQQFFDTAYEARLGGDPRHVLGLRGGVAAQQLDLLLPSVGLLPAVRFDNRAEDRYAQLDYRRGDPAHSVFAVRLAWTGFAADVMPAGVYQPFTLNTDVFDADVRTTWEGDGHALTAGAGYRLATFGTRDADVSDGRHDVHQGWLFVQDEAALAPALAVTVGARVDLHSTTDASVSPRLAGVWQFTDGHYLRLSAGRGFRNASLRELWFDMPLTGVPGATTPVTVRGDTRLDPERLTSYEAGWFGSWGGVVDMLPGAIPGVGDTAHRFEAGVTGFYNRVDDLISFAVEPGDPTLVLPRNGVGEEAFGTEVEGRYVFSDWFSAFGNHAWSHRRDRATETRNALAPEHKVNLGLSFTGDRVAQRLADVPLRPRRGRERASVREGVQRARRRPPGAPAGRRPRTHGERGCPVLVVEPARGRCSPRAAGRPEAPLARNGTRVSPCGWSRAAAALPWPS